MGAAIPYLISLLAGLATVYGILQTFVGLRAKSRLHNEIVVRSMRDAHLREILRLAHEQKLDASALADAIDEIMKISAERLSENDRKLIVSGLNQPSRAGARRYVTDIFTAA